MCLVSDLQLSGARIPCRSIWTPTPRSGSVSRLQNQSMAVSGLGEALQNQLRNKVDEAAVSYLRLWDSTNLDKIVMRTSLNGVTNHWLLEYSIDPSLFWPYLRYFEVDLKEYFVGIAVACGTRYLDNNKKYCCFLG